MIAAFVRKGFNGCVMVPVVHIIDDDARCAARSTVLFRSTGLAARQYESVAAFMEAAPSQDAPGCLVLDVRMPGMNGLDFQQRLDELVRLPAIMMTGYGDIPMSVRAMKAGAVDFLAKPFRDQEMLDAVASALEKRSSSPRGERQGRCAGRRRINAVAARAAGHGLGGGGQNEQAGRRRPRFERNHSQNPPRPAAMRKMGAKTLADLVRMAEALDLRADQP